MRLHPRSIGQRIAAVRPPMLANHIAPGCTGTVVELCGYRAFGIRFDGLSTITMCLPEDLVRLPSDAPSVPATPRFKPRGKFVAAGGS